MSAKQSPEKIKKAVFRLCRKIGWGLPGDPCPRGSNDPRPNPDRRPVCQRGESIHNYRLSHEKKAFVLDTQVLDVLKTETEKEGYGESGAIIGEGCQTEVNKNRLTLMRKSELTRIPECQHIKF